MELLYWASVDRKRNKHAKWNSPDYVLGYDLDVDDLAALITKHNAETIRYEETNRLMQHVLTMMNIVFEHRDINPSSKAEKEALADAMFVDMWGAFKHITPERNPYSYLYRCGFTAAKRYYTKLYKTREKEAAIQQHLDDVYEEYMAENSTGKVPCHRPG